MNYKELLNKLIKESGLSNKEIVAKCEELGVKITPNYLSVIKNNDDKIPSDKLSLALAKACNSKYENILLIQGYLDKSPAFIINYLDNVMKQSLKSFYRFLENDSAIPNEIKNEFLISKKELEDNTFLSQFICESENFEINDDDDFIKIITPEIKWALIPIANPDKIRILSNKEAEPYMVD